MGIARGYQLSQALYVAAKLGVADLLASQPLEAGAIADAVGARASPLRRVLRALVAAGVFCELEDGRFATNEAAAALRAGAAGGMRDVVISFGEEMYRAFGELLHTVRTGETAFDRVYGVPLFEYYAANPESEASAAARMLARTLPAAREFAASDVLRGARTVVDVGGGTGTLVAEVLRHRLEITGVLLERPGMLALAKHYLSEQGVADRCELVEGDFFSSVPAGGDVYVLKSVLHDWDDERCVAILRNCRAAMDDAARLVIVELILPERATPSAPILSAALLDLIMLAYAGGRERTEPEFAALLDHAGLRLTSTTALTAGPHLVEAVRRLPTPEPAQPEPVTEMRFPWRRRPSASPSAPVLRRPRPPVVAAAPDLTDLENQARHHRDRLALYRARMHGAHPTSVGRLQELERAATAAEERLLTARRLSRAEPTDPP
jgi:hypothetical protein